MKGLQWREERGGTFVKETLRFRLQVHWTGSRENARFMVLKRRAARAAILVGSGTTGRIWYAMRAAEKMAERFTISDRHNRPLVIVVDDDTAVSGAADALRDERYDVIEATSAEGALRRLERIGRPTILVTNLCLGSGMTGLELAATVSDLSPATGVLLMSANHLDGNDVLPHTLLGKPFSAKQLVHAVAAAAATRCGLQ